VVLVQVVFEGSSLQSFSELTHVLETFELD